MNLSVDPCQDFYEYSCGNWVANVKIPQGYSKWGTFGEVYSKNQDLLFKASKRNIDIKLSFHFSTKLTFSKVHCTN